MKGHQATERSEIWSLGLQTPGPQRSSILIEKVHVFSGLNISLQIQTRRGTYTAILSQSWPTVRLNMANQLF